MDVFYHRMTNYADDPNNAFEINLMSVIELRKHYVIQGVHHSHTMCNPVKGERMAPSYADMQSQLQWEVPFYITCLGGKPDVYYDFFGWGDQLPISPLRSRVFRSGVHDCYSLVRDVRYLLDGTVLPDGPRSMNWWDNKHIEENPLADRWEKEGLYQVSEGDVQMGDILFFQFRNGVPSHCGIYLANDIFCHHLYGRLSKCDVLGQWGRHWCGTYRYEANPVRVVA